MKSRYSLLVTLALAVSLLTATWAPAIAGSSPPVAGTVEMKPGTKPGAQPATGEPDNGGNTTPIPSQQVQRAGQLLAHNLGSGVFWQLLVQWLLENANVQSRERPH